MSNYHSHRHTHHASQFALTHPSGLSQDEIDTWEAKFCKWQTWVNLSCIPTGLAFLFLTHYALMALNRRLINSDGLAGYRVPYQSVIWWFFPGFGALCLCFEISLQIWAIFVSHKIINLYSEWDSRQPKNGRGGVTYYDARKVLRWFTLLIALPICLISALALRMHTTFASDGIYEFGYAFSKPKVHQYTEIRRAVRVDGIWNKHNKFIERPYVVIDFAGGERWSQENWDDSNRSTTDTVESLLQKNLNFPITSADTIEQLSPWSPK